MHYYSKIRQKWNFKLPDFWDFFKLSRIYFCTGIYFFNLAILFSPAYKIAIWEELGGEPEKDFRKGFGSSLKKPRWQKWKECRWTEKKNSPSWNNIISPSLTNNFTFIPVFNTVALSLHTSSIGYFLNGDLSVVQQILSCLKTISEYGV